MTLVALFIDHNVPLPSPVRSPIGQAMRDLEVGQSFLITDPADYARVRARWSNHAPAKFAMRKVPHQGWRVWRIE
jgi:uncharacterized protein (DUF2249 family)